MAKLGKYSRQIKVIGSYFSASLIPMLISLAINPFIAMNMSPNDYTITGYYTAFNSLVSPIILFYFIHYYQKRYFEISNEERLNLKALIFKGLIYFSGFTALICFAGIYVYIKFINRNFTLPVFPYLIFTLVTVYLTGIYNLELSDYKMSRKPNRFFKLSVAFGVLTGLLSLLFVVFIKWGAFGKLLGPLLCNLLVFIFLLVQNRELFKIYVPIHEFKRVIVFCLPLATGAALGYFMNGFDRTYLEGIGRVDEYSNYIVGCQIGLYINVFATAISTTFSPDICESIAKKNSSRFWKYSILQISLIGLVVVIFVILCPFVIKVLTAGRYMGAVPFACIIAVSSITSNIYYIVNYYSIATNRPRLYLYTTVVGSIIIIALYPVIIPKFEYIGGAVMVVSSYIILSIINIVFLKVIK